MSCWVSYLISLTFSRRERGDLPLKVIRAERITDLYADRAAGRRAVGKDILPLLSVYVWVDG